MSALLLAVIALASVPADGSTAALEIHRFTGTWYELARYDHFFERGCEGVTATYTLDSRGELRIISQCLKGGLNGRRKEVEVKAWAPDAKEPGKLKVQFLWPFTSDYWFLEIDPDYRWALVGDATKGTCWIWSRTPKVDEAEYALLLEKLKGRGYDLRKLLRVQQPQQNETPSQSK